MDKGLREKTFECVCDIVRWRRVKEKSGADISLLLSINITGRGEARFNVLIRRTNPYQQYICLQKKFTMEDLCIKPVIFCRPPHRPSG